MRSFSKMKVEQLLRHLTDTQYKCEVLGIFIDENRDSTKDKRTLDLVRNDLRNTREAKKLLSEIHKVIRHINKHYPGVLEGYKNTLHGTKAQQLEMAIEIYN